jgi:hypothetical protein
LHRRIDVLFDIERTINGQSAVERRAVRQEQSAPLVADLGRRGHSAPCKPAV